MMKRKLIQQGAGSLVVSMPKQFCDQLHLKKGDEVDVQIDGNKILIAAEEQKVTRDITIKLNEELETSVRTIITNAYRAGYDNITIHFQNNTQYEMLVTTTQRHLLGCEITERTNNQCTIRMLASLDEDEFQLLFRKVFQNFKLLLQLLKEKIDKKTLSDNPEIVEERIKRYDNFCKRMVMRNVLKTKNVQFLWTFMTLLVHANRHIYFILETKSQITNEKQLHDLLSIAHNMLELLEQGYIHKDIVKCEQVHKYYNDHKLAIQEIPKTKESTVISHIDACIRQLYLSSSSLMGFCMLS